MSGESQPEEAGSSAERLEELVAEAIDLLECDGQAALESFLKQHAQEAPRLRSRLAALSRVGMLQVGSQNRPKRCGSYRLLEHLGGGGMGQVYLAEDERTGQTVAVKFGPSAMPSLSSDSDSRANRARERFTREVEALQGLEHPGIVPILEVGEKDGQAWFAMEYADGLALDRVLEGLRARNAPASELTAADIEALVPGAIPGAFGSTWVEAIGRIILQVARALSAAHSAGVVHRDIKPSNIVLRRDGRAQVLDFGLAHLGDLPTLTLSGEFAGTPYYVAPEQIEGHRGGIDQRVDVFSLGVTLYECACLQRPFIGETAMEVLSAISARDPLPLRRISPHLPLDLERLCQAALEKDREQRYPSMQALAADVERLLAFRPLGIKAPTAIQRAKRWARRKPWQAVAASLAATLLVCIPVGLLVANIQIRKQRDQVRNEAEWKTAVVEHFVGHFERTGKDAGTDDAAHALLERGVDRLRGGFKDQPRVRAALLHASGRAFLELGRPQDARPLFDRALGMLQRGGADAQPEMIRVLVDLGATHLMEGRAEIAKDLVRRALATPNKGRPPEDVGRRAHTVIAAAEAQLGNSREAREQLSALEPIRDGEIIHVAAVWETLAAHALAQGQFTEAEGALQSALALRLRAWSPDALALAQLHESLEKVIVAQGAGADPRAREHLARAARLRESKVESTARSIPAPFPAEPAWVAAYTDAFARAIASLQAEKFDAARSAFIEALDVRPHPSITAYNLACVAASAGRLEEAANWLRRAHAEGFACTSERAHALDFDADIGALRNSELGTEPLALLRAQWADVKQFAQRDVLRPASGHAPLLVVLHGHGAGSLERAEELWGEVAESMGASILVPRAPFLIGANAAWTSDEPGLWRRPEDYGGPVLARVREVLAQLDVDRERLYVVGEGKGAMLALELMQVHPGLFRGALLVDPVLAASSGTGAGRLCSALGSRLAVQVNTGAPPIDAIERNAELHRQRVTRWLVEAGAWGNACRVAPKRSGDPEASQLTELLRWVDGAD